MKIPLMVCAALAFSVSAYGQAMVGYGLNTGRAAVAGGALNKTGKATAATLDKSAQALSKADAGVAAAKPEAAAPAKAPEAAKPPVDVAALSSGLDREELLKQFGKPSMKLSNSDGPDLVEKYFYKSAAGEKVVVTLRNGKVVLP